jgi:EAL domain-containing protein (putative c-di-GMP-specific phosphodiesterase class I)/CheY-like chemotaxis protein
MTTKQTILIVDDEDALRPILRFYLEAADFRVIEANNGLDGLEAARQQLPDLILCDIAMPQMDGYELLTQLIGDPVTATIPFIFLTAFNTANNFRQGMELGADDFLIKPVNRNALIQAVRTRLAKRQKLFYMLANDITPNLSPEQVQRQTLKADLRNALAQHQFQVHYQPQYDTFSRQVVGAEALLRWQHPQLGNVPPTTFIPLAEEIGVLDEITTWVLQTACRQCQHWRIFDNRKLRIAVNISASRLSRPGLADEVRLALEQTGLAAGQLEIEVTESTLLESVAQTTETLQALEELGVKLTIDDFGTGYASLSYLSQLPFRALKIDQSFVRGLPDDRRSHEIVRAVIGLAQSLNLHIVAEGVETTAQYDLLQEWGCQEVQGFLFARALPPAEFENLLIDTTRKALAI